MAFEKIIQGSMRFDVIITAKDLGDRAEIIDKFKAAMKANGGLRHEIKTEHLIIEVVSVAESAEFKTVRDEVKQWIRSNGVSEKKSELAMRYVEDNVGVLELGVFRNKALGVGIESLNWDDPMEFVDLPSYPLLFKMVKPRVHEWVLRDNKNAWYLRNFAAKK